MRASGFDPSGSPHFLPAEQILDGEHRRVVVRAAEMFMRAKVGMLSVHWVVAIALLVAYYNWCRVCEPLRVSPAIEMGLTDHIWSVGELLREAATAPPIEPITPPAAVYPRPGRRPFKLIVGGRNTKVR